jgi:hypothetical protein
MSDMTFYKTVNDAYDLVFDFSDMIVNGEVIKHITIQEIEDVTIMYDIYDKYMVLVRVDNGVLDTMYPITVTVKTSRRKEYTLTLDLIIDEYSSPFIYNDFSYSFLSYNNSLYIIPLLIKNDDGSYSSGFKYNTEYITTISNTLTSANDLKLDAKYSFMFTSKYCPMFTYASIIIMMLGPEAEKFTVDTINRYIHKNSMEAIDLVNVTPNYLTSNKIPYDYFGCTPDKVPYHLRRYVECKTAYDLLNLLDRLRKIDGSNGGQTKTLGDMTIKYGGDAGSSTASTGRNPKDDFYDCFNSIFHMITNGINSAVRGKYDTTKGFPHPTFDVNHNRITKPNPNSKGPWNSSNTRYPKGGF